MDAWFYFCKLIVHGAIFEFAIILKISTNPAKVSTKEVNRPDLRPNRRIARGDKKPEDDHKLNINVRCKKLDAMAFIIFNVVFAAFIISYLVFCT